MILHAVQYFMCSCNKFNLKLLRVSILRPKICLLLLLLYIRRFDKQKTIERLIYVAQKNSSRAINSEKGMLNITGRATPYQRPILICSSPNVRKKPAIMDKPALKSNPT